ncbi:hypothetical protein Scep_015095 [Stephania cephalantha]|uniref:Uncharacterized protein n=1 Tax=Stephania cephalantha TaxID=152367 RepID=A0AAP0P140_9MAGN
MVGMVNEAMDNLHIGSDQMNDNMPEIGNRSGPNEETFAYLRLLQEAKQELYPGCNNFTALSFIVHLLNIKVLCSWTYKLFTMLLELLKKSFSSSVRLPQSYYKANKMTTDLGFTSETFDACPNNCMLFRNEDANLDECEICHTSRFKQSKDGSSEGKKVATKKLDTFH